MIILPPKPPPAKSYLVNGILKQDVTDMQYLIYTLCTSFDWYEAAVGGFRNSSVSSTSKSSIRDLISNAPFPIQSLNQLNMR